MKNPRDAGSTSGIEVVSNQHHNNHDFSPPAPAKQVQRALIERPGRPRLRTNPPCQASEISLSRGHLPQAGAAHPISFSDPTNLGARKRRQPERELQRALIDHLSWRAPSGTWWTHFPAGGRRSRVTGAILKSMGTKPGCPDIFILSYGKLFGLELKAGRNGLSPAQIETHAAMRAAGAVIGTAGTLDDALAILSEWGLLR
jgi:hypothetical protein